MSYVNPEHVFGDIFEPGGDTIASEPMSAEFDHTLHETHLTGWDGKNFTDSSLKESFTDTDIAARFRQERFEDGFTYRDFVERYYDPPAIRTGNSMAELAHDASDHVAAMWDRLTLHRTEDEGSLRGLPNPFVAPGERFSESFYWDSYFTMRGLAAEDKWDMVEGMVDNCVAQIDRFGYVPNGSREYLEGRSQPAFFSHMVRLVAEHQADLVREAGADETAAGTAYGEKLVQYPPAMVKEHEFWMTGRDDLALEAGGETSGMAVEHTGGSLALRRVVLLPDGSVLNRYYGETHEAGEYDDVVEGLAKARPESWLEDVLTAREAGEANPTGLNRTALEMRAGAESGWDYSGRWLRDPQRLSTIEATNIVPVDLNSLLYDLEATIADASEAAGLTDSAVHYRQAAAARLTAINAYHWSEQQGFYLDYALQARSTDEVGGEQVDYPSMAAAFPLHSGIASAEQADKVATRLEKDFLRADGFATTLVETPQQWDGPAPKEIDDIAEKTGVLWAPLQTIAIQGLRSYGVAALADKARDRFLDANLRGFAEDRQFHEKIVIGEDKGEYKLQNGFGWMNAFVREALDETRIEAIHEAAALPPDPRFL